MLKNKIRHPFLLKKSSHENCRKESREAYHLECFSFFVCLIASRLFVCLFVCLLDFSGFSWVGVNTFCCCCACCCSMPALNRRNRTSKAIPNDKVDQPLGEKKNGQTAILVQYHKKIVYGTAISSSSATSTSENADDN